MTNTNFFFENFLIDRFIYGINHIDSMRKIISGKVYNTETATLLAEHDNGLPYSDFKFRVGKLFRTQKGAFFVYNQGGAFTDMSVSVGNNGRGGSSDITALTESEAMELASEWHAERLIGADELEAVYEAIGVKLEAA